LRWPCVGDHDLFALLVVPTNTLEHQDAMVSELIPSPLTNAHRVSAAIGQRLQGETAIRKPVFIFIGRHWLSLTGRGCREGVNGQKLTPSGLF
jgi:hypothetical protein